MGLKLSSIKADLRAETEGEWHDVPEWPGVRIKARSVNYKPFQIARETALRKERQKLRRDPTSLEFEGPLARLVGEHLLLAVEGVDGDDGKPVVLSNSDDAIALLSPPDMRALVAVVLAIAYRVGEKEAEFTDAAIKNSEVPSAST